MCTTLGKPTLEAAVKFTVEHLIAANEKFSAYDVTVIMRQEVSSAAYKGGTSALPTLDTNETGTVQVHGDTVPKISHEEVRGLVHGLFHNGKMTGYDRVHTGQHFEYMPASSVPPPAPTSTPDPNAGSVPPATGGGNYDGNPTL